MLYALEKAKLAIGGGDIPIAAIIVKNEHIIAESYNRVEIDNDSTAHCELLAIKKAIEYTGNKHLHNCSMYVTLEPCYMCSGAIVLARIPELIFGACDPKTGSAGSIYNIVHDSRLNHQCNVIGGVMESECSQLIKQFFAELREKSNV